MIKWYGDKLFTDVESVMHSRLNLAGAVVVDKTKRLLNVQGRPSVASQKKGKKVKHSRPGQAPFWQSRLLLESITQESASRTEERVGTNVKYAPWLELGTRNIAPRPFLRPGLSQSQKKITQILTAPIK